MGANTNTIDRLPAKQAIDTTFVFDISVLPAPVSNVITLLPGNYVISDQVDFGLNSLKFDSAGQNLTLQSLDGRTSTISSATTGTFIDIVNAEDVNLLSLKISLSGDNAEFWNVLGITGTVNCNNVRTTFTGGGTPNIGTLGSGNAVITNMGMLNFRDGLVIENVGGVALDSSFMVSDFQGTGPMITVNSIANPTTISSVGMFGVFAQSAFFVNPTINPLNGQLNIFNVPFDAAVSYFELGQNSTITNIVDASTSSLSVTAVNDVSSLAEYETSVAHNYIAGDIVFHTNFATAGYLGSKTVASVPTSTTYLTGDTFVIDETGNSIAPRATVTSAGHSQTLDTAVLIEQTLNFDAGYLVKNPLTNTFVIWLPFLFPGVETTGTWNAGSLNETDKRMNVRDSGKQKDSMNVAFGGMNANAGATTIALVDTYQAMDFNTMVEDPTSERWALIDATNGIFRYEGLNPVTGTLVASITVVKTGSTEVYRFTDSKNGVIPVFGSKAYVPIEVKTTQVSGTLIRPISVVPGDTIQVMGAGQGTTNSVTITDFFMEMMF